MDTSAISSIQQSLASGYYGLVNLALASAAYYTGQAGETYGNQFKSMIAGLAPLPTPADQTPLPDDASWQLDWGPATNKHDANMVYVATYGQGTGADRTNLLRVVGVRGTDIGSTEEGVMKQLVEDLSAFVQGNWMGVLDAFAIQPHCNPFGRKVVDGEAMSVASGSALALESVLRCRVVLDGVGTEKSFIEHLHAQADLDATPLVVTGHSLGGALTQMVSAYLAWQVVGAFTKLSDFGHEPQATNIFPAAFAPPTVGGPDFAARYTHIFPNQYFYFNDGDVVPYAYTDVAGIEQLWSGYPDVSGSCTPQPCPQTLVDTIAGFGDQIPAYARPGANQVEFAQPYLCDGLIMKQFLENCGMDTMSPDSWVAQLVWQHFPPAYYLGISAKVASLAPYPSFAAIPSGLLG